MRCVLFLMACGCALGLGSFAMAEDRVATTDQLPAALQVLDGAADSLVTESEAREVRGTWYYPGYYGYADPWNPEFQNYLYNGGNNGYYGDGGWQRSSPSMTTYGGVYWDGYQYTYFERTMVRAQDTDRGWVEASSWSENIHTLWW